MFKRFRLLVLVTSLCLPILATDLYATSVFVNFDAGTTNETTALTGFSTYGDMMDGMGVTAYFSGGSSQTAYWADTGAGAGAASGTGWSLSESGDTFGSNWVLYNASAGAISGVVIDAGIGDTVFDRSWSGEGTPGSALGRTFQVVSGGTGLDIVATYRNLVALSGFAPVGDLYRHLDLQFRNAGEFGSGRRLYYRADTDNILYAGDIRPIPEPATLFLFVTGLAGAGIGALRRRRKQ